MRVFVTGASGYIGSAVVRDLVGAGHQVVGLARSDRSVARVRAAGATPHRGTLEDLEALHEQAAAADGVIHAAFGAVRREGNLVSPADYTAAVEAERRAIQTLGQALAGSDRPLVITSGTAGLAPGRVATERDVLDPAAVVALRAPMEATALALVEYGVRVSAVRLAPSVHGPGDYGFVPTLISIARRTGVSARLGDGSNHWAAVHRTDAARLYRLALEAAPAGARLHAVGDQGVPFRDLAEAIGRQLNVPVVGVDADAAEEHFGWFAPIAALDNQASSDLTRAQVGWAPEQPGLIADLDAGHYFSV